MSFVIKEKDETEKLVYLSPAKYYQHTPLTQPTYDLLCLHEKFKAFLCHQISSSSSTPIEGLLYTDPKDVPSPLSFPVTPLSHCYLLTITPSVNYLLSGLTCARDEEGMRYQFKGFLILSPFSLDHVSAIPYKQYGNSYEISIKPHPFPESFILHDVILFMQYLFVNSLNLFDWFNELISEIKIYFMPKFVREEKNVSYMLSMGSVLESFFYSFKPLSLKKPLYNSEEVRISRLYSDSILCNIDKRPSCVRVDRIKWKSNGKAYLIHNKCFTEETSSKTYVSKESQLMDLHKQQSSRNLKRSEYSKLKQLRRELRNWRKHHSKREEEVELSCHGYNTTGLYTDVTQYALLCPLVSQRVKFDFFCDELQSKIQYQFKDTSLLKLSLTHPNYIYSPNNHRPLITELPIAIANCGMRETVTLTVSESKSTSPPPAKRVKKGLEGLMDALTKIDDKKDEEKEEGEEDEKEEENIMAKDNERLEFLGDAVLEFLCSLQLYLMFPDITNSQIVQYRGALVCNEHLATVAKRLELQKYLLLNCFEDKPSGHTLANTLEALVGAVYLDGRINSARQVLATVLFPEQDLKAVWLKDFKDPLQMLPEGDRHMISNTPVLQSFVNLENEIGITFTNIRLLARAFTHCSYGRTNLLLGDYEKMEFLGDAILQLLASTYVYESFPLHHEGHLSTFRIAIVANKQLTVVSRELGFPQYMLRGKEEQKREVTDKNAADLIESFLTALFLDKGMEYVKTFCQVCVFPKLAQHVAEIEPLSIGSNMLHDHIKGFDQKLKQPSTSVGLQFLDAKTRLQHAIVHTCKSAKKPVITPTYRLLTVEGPSHCQKFKVGVYLKDKRIATGTGKSRQKAGMDAAEKAMKTDFVKVPAIMQLKEPTT